MSREITHLTSQAKPSQMLILAPENELIDIDISYNKSDYEGVVSMESIWIV